MKGYNCMIRQAVQRNNNLFFSHHFCSLEKYCFGCAAELINLLCTYHKLYVVM